MIKHFKLNEKGRDWVVGDVHGCFSLLEAQLCEIGFDCRVDRLFSVGDLVDRGTESEQSIRWLRKPWFFAVRGNHEQMAIDYFIEHQNTNNYLANGGAWFISLTSEVQALYAEAFLNLPIALEVDTNDGLVGIIHAECPFKKWADMKEGLASEHKDGFISRCLWSRDKIGQQDRSSVEGITSIIVGHTPVLLPLRLGNVQYIDTGAVFGNRLTIMEL